jgi:hypothetical protein
METIKVKKDELLQIVKDNRKKHKTEYAESIRAYRVKAGDLFARELEKIISGEKFVTSISIQKPESHIKDYDLVIQMLKMSVDDVIEMGQYEFNQYVNDDWSWKQTFSSSVYSNSRYNDVSAFSGSGAMTGTTYDVKFAEDETFNDEE